MEYSHAAQPQQNNSTINCITEIVLVQLLFCFLLSLNLNIILNLNIKMLPPGFQDKNAHYYGTLTLTINCQTNCIQINSVQPHFFGSSKNTTHPATKSNKIIINYTVTTNLWHFYAYLADCRSIPIMLTTQSKQSISCDLPITLLNSKQVLSDACRLDDMLVENGYIVQTLNNLDLFDQRRNKIGRVQVQLGLKFQPEIHRIIWSAGLIDFDQILVIDQISPIGSTCELQNMSLPIEEAMPCMPEKTNQKQFEMHMNKHSNKQLVISPIKSQYLQIIGFQKTNSFQKQKEANKSKQKQVPSSKQSLFGANISLVLHPQQEQDQKAVEDDIDRMIAEMQSKHYDPSKYIQNPEPNKTNINENVNYSNFGTISQFTKQSNNQQQNIAQRNPSIEKPPKYPQTITNYKNSQRQIRSVSPHTKFINTAPISTAPINTALSQTLISNNNYSQVIFSSTPKKHHSQSCSQSARVNVSHKSGTFKLKVHEVIFQRPQPQLSLILKIYLNNQKNQFYSVNSLRQGQAISFNCDIKIDKKIELRSIQFNLIDAFDLKTIVAKGVFDLSRLFAQSPTKGIFMINMTSHSQSPIHQSNYSRVIKIDEQQLTRVIPNQKTLRIQIQYEQSIQIVQVYLNLSNFSSVVKSCRYKIPMTKQPIQFRTVELVNSRHINIFPHNRLGGSGGVLIIQLWGQNSQLIGFSEVSLRALANTNQQLIGSSLEPIYLYDEERDVSAMRAGKKGQFHLKLCYGTVGQVQNLINMGERKLVRQNSVPMQQVAVEDHLGIYIKQNKNKRQVETQVDQMDHQQDRKDRVSLLQQQQQPQDDEQGECIQILKQNHNDSKLLSQNQFMTMSMEQKYNPNNQGVIHSLNKNAVNHKNNAQITTQSKTQLNLSQSQNIKQRPTLRSLTKQFQKIIAQCLSQLKQQGLFIHLKNTCKPHLLYNFIQQQSLRSIFTTMGMNQSSINLLINDILPTSNGMVNVNVLYDMIYGLILQQQIREKYIDDGQLAKYCLGSFYEQEGKDEMDGEQIVIDNQMEFEQVRKMYERLGFKITMRQFTVIQNYLKKQLQAKNSCRTVKTQLVGKTKIKKCEAAEKKQYQQQVISNLYQNEWDDDDDFFIANINQGNRHQSQTMPTNCIENSEIRNNGLESNTFLKESGSYSNPDQANCTVKKEFQIFAKTKNNYFQENKKQILPNNGKSIQNQLKTNLISKDYLSTTPKLQPKAQNSQCHLTIEGLQNCIQTAQCHLNVALISPSLRLSYQQNGETAQTRINRIQDCQCYRIELSLQRQAEYLDGSLQLLSCGKIIARCIFSIMSDVRSVYTLKSSEGEFCGLLYLLFGH